MTKHFLEPIRNGTIITDDGVKQVSDADVLPCLKGENLIFLMFNQINLLNNWKC